MEKTLPESAALDAAASFFEKKSLLKEDYDKLYDVAINIKIEEAEGKKDEASAEALFVIAGILATSPEKSWRSELAYEWLVEKIDDNQMKLDALLCLRTLANNPEKSPGHRVKGLGFISKILAYREGREFGAELRSQIRQDIFSCEKEFNEEISYKNPSDRLRFFQAFSDALGCVKRGDFENELPLIEGMLRQAPEYIVYDGDAFKETFERLEGIIAEKISKSNSEEEALHIKLRHRAASLMAVFLEALRYKFLTVEGTDGKLEYKEQKRVAEKMLQIEASVAPDEKEEAVNSLVAATGVYSDSKLRSFYEEVVSQSLQSELGKKIKAKIDEMEFSKEEAKRFVAVVSRLKATGSPQP